LERRYLDVLRELYARLEGPEGDVLWVVTGSAGFALQGLLVTVHDIDIQTDTAGAYEIERRFATFVTGPVRFADAERIRSHLGALALRGITVEVMGDIQKRLPRGAWQAPVDLARHRRTIPVADMLIPVLGRRL
jgi:hypothetical protein